MPHSQHRAIRPGPSCNKACSRCMKRCPHLSPLATIELQTRFVGIGADTNRAQTSCAHDNQVEPRSGRSRLKTITMFRRKESQALQAPSSYCSPSSHSPRDMTESMWVRKTCRPTISVNNRFPWLALSLEFMWSLSRRSWAKREAIANPIRRRLASPSFFNSLHVSHSNLRSTGPGVRMVPAENSHLYGLTELMIGAPR